MAKPVLCRGCNNLHDPLMPCPPAAVRKVEPVMRTDWRDDEIAVLRAQVIQLERELADRRRRKADAQKRWRDGQQVSRGTLT